MLIGELASRTGVAARTLRFYETAALLPDPDRTPAGYRDYPERAADRVRFIKDAQAAGFTLAQIREVLSIRDEGRPPCEHVTDLVSQRLAEVDARIRELRSLREQLQAVERRAREYDPAECGDYCDLISSRELHPAVRTR